jgi:GR25 family glycosyltransferase involved in LPS biosynthesis
MEEVTNEFKDWPVPIERISAVKYKPGWKGCSASHIKAVKLAKERNYPWVVILEDDCILTPIAAQQFQSLLPYLWKNRSRWDIFYGGTSIVKEKPQIRISYSPPMYQTLAYTTHFCLIHKSTYDRILSNYPRNIVDFKQQIDVYYSQILRIWTTTPFFALQRSGKSDISSKEITDYTEIFKESERILLEL